VAFYSLTDPFAFWRKTNNMGVASPVWQKSRDVPEWVDRAVLVVEPPLPKCPTLSTR
jgi:hypothetical protein